MFESIKKHLKKDEPKDLNWHIVYVGQFYDQVGHFLDKSSDGNYVGEINQGVYKFLNESFKMRDWSEMRRQNGFYMEVIGFKFRNEEDAMAFKLRWA